MKDEQKPGYGKNTSLSVRMKEYEEVTTGASLVPRIPVYVRVDGRAFHSFCRGLGKPFDMDFVGTMKRVTAYLHEKTNARVSFCQSDEISLVYDSPEKMPFGTRLFKIQSVLAGMASSAFCVFGCDGTSPAFAAKIRKSVPHFDCRVCQMPMDECANMLQWRSMDSVKNSITMLALAHFSTAQIHGRNGDEKIRMLAEQKCVDYYALPEDLRMGAFFRRETYVKTLTDEELAKIPERQRNVDPDGKMRATRSHVVQFWIGMPLARCANKAEVLFDGAAAVERTPAPEAS